MLGQWFLRENNECAVCDIILFDMKYLLTIIILVSLGYGLYYYSNTDTSPTDSNSIVVENNDSVIKYVSANISELSSEKEVLGGTFYITNIVADAGTGTVDYEDGHNAYQANFSYSFDEKGKVQIDSFQIVE